MSLLLRRITGRLVGNLTNLRHIQLAYNSNAPEEAPPLKMSETCIKKLKEVSGPNEALRITVDSGGCSGFQYSFDLDTNVTENDVVIEEQGVRIVSDKTSLGFLEGAVIDYHEEMIKSSFRVMNNPKAEAGCSCGMSFAVKLD